jgi:hypothetical protein
MSHLNIARYWIEMGADIHANEEEALRISANNKDYNTLVYLLDLGADYKFLSR